MMRHSGCLVSPADIVLISGKKIDAGERLRVASWRPRQESNLQSSLRRGKLYPFNYRDKANCVEYNVSRMYASFG